MFCEFDFVCRQKTIWLSALTTAKYTNLMKIAPASIRRSLRKEKSESTQNTSLVYQDEVSIRRIPWQCQHSPPSLTPRAHRLLFCFVLRPPSSPVLKKTFILILLTWKKNMQLNRDAFDCRTCAEKYMVKLVLERGVGTCS